jgi:hypothetical protein
MEMNIEAPAPASQSDIQKVAAAVEGFRKRKDTQLARMATVSRGDVTKVEGYENLVACVGQLTALQSGYGSGALGPALTAVQDALAGLLNHKKAFMASFNGEGAEAVQYIYVGAVMASFAAVSMLIAEAISFAPNPQTGYMMPRVDETGAGRVAKSILVARLTRFAAAAQRKDFEQAALAMASRAEEAAMAEAAWGDLAGLATFAGIGAAGAALTGVGVLVGAGIGLILGLLYAARDIAAYVYASRTKAAQWLELQANFLEANAAALQPGQRVPKETQMRYVQTMRQLADRIKIDAAEADREATAVSHDEDRALGAGNTALRLI